MGWVSAGCSRIRKSSLACTSSAPGAAPHSATTFAPASRRCAFLFSDGGTISAETPFAPARQASHEPEPSGEVRRPDAAVPDHTRTLLVLHGGAVEIRDPDVYARQPFAPLYDLSHAAERLGFVAEYDQRHLLKDAPGFASGGMK